ncbi:melatonin receptor type 1B-A-like [Amphiura filiformis]|uniref:melatonin receptor type 1B-A-like n=1 Tax=Amphiura filiformis TaxID=82378 RepID=UPI003B20FE0D
MESLELRNCSESIQASTTPESLKLVFAVIMAFMAIAGTLGNTLLIAAVAVYDKLRSVHNIFIVNLAVADLFVTTLVIPFAIVGAIGNGSFFCQHDAICQVMGLLLVVSCGTSVWSIASIAIERYIYICYNHVYFKIYNRVTFPIIIVCIWVYAFLLDLPNFVGWGEHLFKVELLACTFRPVRGYIWFINVFGGGIPFLILSFCYTQIYLFVRRVSFKQFILRRASSDSTSTITGIKSADKHLLKILAVIILFFVLMWTPFMWLMLVNSYTPLPHWLLYICGNLCLANSAVNFWIYAFNKDFRDGYLFIIKRIKRQKKGEEKIVEETKDKKRAVYDNVVDDTKL